MFYKMFEQSILQKYDSISFFRNVSKKKSKIPFSTSIFRPDNTNVRRKNNGNPQNFSNL